jgi:hypothetical protein
VAGLALVLSGLLTGCGGGGGGNADVPATESAAGHGGDPDNRYPLAIGDRWIWRKSSSTSNASTATTTKVDEVTGQATVQGTTAFVIRRRDSVTGQWEDAPDYQIKTDAGVFELAASTATADLLAGQRRLEVLRFPLQAGTHHVALDQPDLDFGVDIDGDGVNERHALHTEVTVIGVETITVPAGTFRDALHVVTVTRQVVRPSRQPATTLTGTITYDDWYVPGIGRVKNSELGSYPSGQVRDDLELIDYRVGGRTPPVSPPSWSVIDPPDGIVTLDGTLRDMTWRGPITLRVAAPLLDPRNVADGVVITDTRGQVIAGSTTARWITEGVPQLVWDLSFMARAPLPPGSYAVSLGPSLTDQAGRSIAGLTGSSARLTVLDRVAPWLLAPLAPVVVDVNLGRAQVVLDFSEPIDPASVTPQSFLVTETAGTTPIPVTVTAVEGTRIRLSVPLQSRRDYVLALSSDLRDLNGNALAGPERRGFSTTSSDTTAPQLLGSSPGQDAVDVSPDLTTITLDFSEPIAPASVSLAAFAAGNVATTRVLSVTQPLPTRILLGVALEPSQFHSITGSAGSALLDLSGNETRFQLRFTTAARPDPAITGIGDTTLRAVAASVSPGKNAGIHDARRLRWTRMTDPGPVR